MVIEAGDVLIVRAGERLLGLNHLDAIGHTGSEAVLRPSKALIGEVDVLLCYSDLLFRRIEIEKGRSHVIVNLTANVFGFGLPLPQFSFRLRNLPFDPPSGEDRNTDPGLKCEISVRMTEVWARCRRSCH